MFLKNKKIFDGPDLILIHSITAQPMTISLEFLTLKQINTKKIIKL